MTRGIPIASIALASFIAGFAIALASGDSPAERFVEAWVAGDHAAMHEELSPAAQQETPVAALAAAYEEAAATASITAVRRQGSVEESGDVARAAVTLDTAAFGPLGGELSLPLEDGRIAWAPHLVFPELEPGERLEREARLAERAPILARDGTPLARGPAEAREYPLGDAVLPVTGAMGPAADVDPERAAAAGLPDDVPLGASGLERAFDSRLSGTPGGELIAVGEQTAPGEDAPAGARTLARSQPEPAEPLETTIDAELQVAAHEALGGQLGGVAVLDARSGRVRALAGPAAMAPQPPGSVFKIVTAAAALDADLTSLDQSYPVEVTRVAGGREIRNSSESACGGTLVESFAESCNTVFAPLGVELGAEELVEAAERFGFNQPPSLYGAEAIEAGEPAQSTVPEIESDTELAVTAIGQGRMLTTTLGLASVAQTIANDGVRSPTPIVRDPALGPVAEEVRAAEPETAAALRRMMVAVVADGTGEEAALDGVQVAGKTGTAELGPDPSWEAPEVEPGEQAPEAPQLLDAWFAAFAPARQPLLAISVLVVEAGGDGGVIAAPIAREVLSAGLE